MPVKGVAFYLDNELPLEAKSLLADFRLAVNEAVRAGLQTHTTSRNSLTKVAYKDFRLQHPSMYSQHIVSAFVVASRVLKNHRRRVRKGLPARIPYIKKLFMMAENQAYKLDRGSGVVDLPIRAGCHVKLKLILSEYHRGVLDDTSLSLGSLILLPDRVVIAFRKEERTQYEPQSVLSRHE